MGIEQLYRGFGMRLHAGLLVFLLGVTNGGFDTDSGRVKLLTTNVFRVWYRCTYYPRNAEHSIVSTIVIHARTSVILLPPLPPVPPYHSVLPPLRAHPRPTHISMLPSGHDPSSRPLPDRYALAHAAISYASYTVCFTLLNSVIIFAICVYESD